MKKSSHRIKVINNKTGEIVEETSTGLMYDSWIKAVEIINRYKDKYSVTGSVNDTHSIKDSEVGVL